MLRSAWNNGSACQALLAAISDCDHPHQDNVTVLWARAAVDPTLSVWRRWWQTLRRILSRYAVPGPAVARLFPKPISGPFLGLILGAQITKTRDQVIMPARLPACTSRSASPTYSDRMGAAPTCAQAYSSGSGSGLRVLKVSPLTTQPARDQSPRACSSGSVSRAGFIGDHAQGMATASRWASTSAMPGNRAVSTAIASRYSSSAD